MNFLHEALTLIAIGGLVLAALGLTDAVMKVAAFGWGYWRRPIVPPLAEKTAAFYRQHHDRPASVPATFRGRAAKGWEHRDRYQCSAYDWQGRR